ncbi:MAG: hypothetical protein Hals2KO_06020 [Halioglobus sp.]
MATWVWMGVACLKNACSLKLFGERFEKLAKAYLKISWYQYPMQVSVDGGKYLNASPVLWE